MELVRVGLVKLKICEAVWRFACGYEELEKGDIAGRVVLKIGDDPGLDIG